ncbi:GGDEF domain-containing protein [Pendulispora albinea]|uniref:diguanylate cyclase n=1 Tax=Pendulispora albinea TaxID=2741071 RepID=A0ABZ2M025_9BACT
MLSSIQRADAERILSNDDVNQKRVQLSVPPIGAVLVVDDDEAARWLVVRALARSGIQTFEASNGREAVEHVLERPELIDAIVLDVMMPGLTGFEVIRHIKRIPAAANIPIILVTASATEEDDIVRGVEYGAIDYIMKPISTAVLTAKVRAACERSRAERRLRYDLRFAELHAMIDPLTGLFNRRHFESRIREASAYSKRHDQPFAIVMMDLDHFKSINDTYGHETGDHVLTQFAGAVRSVLRGEDVAFRYGGEEFVLLLRACDAQRAADVAERLQKKLRARPYVFRDGSTRTITFSAGIAAALSGEGYGHAELVSRADAALYRAKSAGRDRIAYW